MSPAAAPDYVDFRDTTGGPFDLTPAAALAYFRAKGLKPTFAWQDALRAEHSAAFTVAKMMDVDLLNDVREAVDAAIAEGMSVAEFRQRLTPLLQEKGWWGKQTVTDPLSGDQVVAQLGSAHRLNTIYRTNMQSAYATGQWLEIEANRDIAPLLLYDAVDDSRTRPEHAALDNLVLPVASTFWKTHFPPNGYNCRCTAIQIDQEQAKDLGLTISKKQPEQSKKLVPYTNPRTGKKYTHPSDLDPGWDHNPGVTRQRRLEELLREKIAGLPAEMRPNAQAVLDLSKIPKAQLDDYIQTNARALRAAFDTPSAAGKAAATKAAQDVAKSAQAQAVALAKAQDAQAALLRAASEPAELERLKAAAASAAKNADADHLKAQDLIAQAAAEVKAKGQLEGLLAIAKGKADASSNHVLQAFKQLQKQPGWIDQPATAKLADLTALAAEKKTKFTLQSALSQYKKAIENGKIPGPAAKAAFATLDAAEQEALLAKAAKAKAKLEAESGLKLASPAPAQPAGIDPTKLTKIGEQKGSNPGGTFQDTDTGLRYYVKTPASEDIARNEVLAAKLYRLAGIDVADVQLTTLNGRTAVASALVEGLEAGTAAQIREAVGTFDGFATDAWLGNWDVVGLGYDNLLLKGGRAVRIDTGGALRYRAQGGFKGSSFGIKVTEIDSLRSATFNAQSANVFGGITDAQLDASVARVLKISDDAIRQTVELHGPVGIAERKALAELLIARKQDLAVRFAKAGETYKLAVAKAVKDAEAAAAEGLKDVDLSFLTAIKGIASRAAKGAAIEAKDIERVAAARAALKAWTADHLHLMPETYDTVRAFYEVTLSQLDQAVSVGAGSKAVWNGGLFKGFAGALAADPAKVPVLSALAQAQLMPAAEANAVLREALGPSAAGIVPRKHPDFEKLPLDHRRAIVAYTGSYYSAVNAALREGVASVAQLRYRDLLNEALGASTKYVGDVKRGLDPADLQQFIKDHQASLATGTPINYPAFQSCSPTKPWNRQVLLRIKQRSGVWVDPISAHQGEAEVLLPAGLNFRVKDLRKVGTRWEIDLEEL